MFSLHCKIDIAKSDLDFSVSVCSPQANTGPQITSPIIQPEQVSRLPVCSPCLDHVGNTDCEVVGHVRLAEGGPGELTRTVRQTIDVSREGDC